MQIFYKFEKFFYLLIYLLKGRKEFFALIGVMLIGIAATLGAIRYGFNSKVFYVATNKSQIILEDKKLSHTLTFRLESDSWNKETLFIQFSGDNSRYLYFLITNGSFFILQLNCQNIKIGRIDIQFIRTNRVWITFIMFTQIFFFHASSTSSFTLNTNTLKEKDDDLDDKVILSNKQKAY